MCVLGLATNHDPQDNLYLLSHNLLRPQLDVGGKVLFYYTPWTFTYEIPSGIIFWMEGTDGGTD